MDSEKTEEKQRLPQWFKPGQSGNIEGRPKGSLNMTTKVKKALESIYYNKNGKEVRADKALIEKILELAIKDGNEKMIKLIWNYLDGLPKQNIDLGGQVNVAYIDILKAIKEKEQSYDTERKPNTENTE